MSKKIHSSEQTKHEMSTSSYFLWGGNIAVNKTDTSLSKIAHSDKEYRFKNNKTINQTAVMLEDKQGEEMEKNRVWVEVL